MAPKKRKFSDAYIKFGFTFIEKDGTQLPQCVICTNVLSNDAMRPNRLERHLTQKHPSLTTKPREFFSSKAESLKRMKLDGSGTFQQDCANHVRASYEIALLIAKQKKPHTIGESLIKPCILSAARTVLGEASEKKMKQLSLSNDTIKRRIDDIAEDITFQILLKIKSSPYFAISCDESTDVSNCAQLIVYVRYANNDKIEEDLLYSQALTGNTKADDIFDSISSFFERNELQWHKLVGVCTDGAPAMMGSRSGLIKKIKEKNPLVTGTHCVIHRQALASKTMPQKLRENLNLAINIVNYVKSSALNSRLFTLLCEDLDSDHKVLLFHTEVRWLSKGNMLGRLYELKEEVHLFLQYQERNDLLENFKSEHFQLRLAFLADIFEALNQLNLKLQGRNSTILNNYDHIQCFIAKLQLWRQRVSSGNMTSFSRLDGELQNGNTNDNTEELKNDVTKHLESLEEEFKRYYEDIDPELSIWKMTRNPFTTDVLDLPTNLQEEFIELKMDSTAKDEFQLLTLEKFWLKRFPINQKTAEVALRTLIPFSSTYLCEAGFSALVTIKNKQRNRINVENDLRVALSTTEPRLEILVQRKQPQVSH